MRLEVAQRRIQTFQERFGEAHLILAGHAAFPLALTPDLLYRLWANFQQDVHGEVLNIPWIAVADLLLSSLCDEVGHELFEMPKEIRNSLLARLKANSRFGSKRIEELSDFLLIYIKQQLESHDPELRDFAQVQRWTALAYVKPEEVAKEIESVFSNLTSKDRTERIRMTSLVATLSESLEEFKPFLLVARRMRHLIQIPIDEASLTPTRVKDLNAISHEHYSSDEVKLGEERREVSVLFSDIRGYTTLTESMEAKEVVQLLNEYFETMVEAVFDNEGTLDKFMGDALVAVFGSSVLPLQDHAWMAVQTAIDMRSRLVRFNADRPNNKIRIGIGINSDSVISVNIGSSQQMEFTAIGDCVNVGSRLESASKLYGCDIVISGSTYIPCADRIWFRELDSIWVKEKNRPVNIYELVGLRDEPISPQKQRSIDLYHEGRRFYLDRKFTKSMTAFGTILEEVNPHDKAAALYLHRCQHWLSYPPTDHDWADGVWTLTDSEGAQHRVDFAGN